MSKIIKANNLFIVKPVDRVPANNDNTFTHIDADALYQETKAMVEELIQEGETKATSIIAEAKKEGLSILEIAQGEAELIREKAYQEGFEQGKKQGYQEVEALKQEVKLTIEKALHQRKKIIEDTEREIIGLSLKIAEKILAQKIEEEESIKTIAQNLLEMVKNAEHVILKVSNEDLEYINGKENQLKAILVHGQLKVDSDNSLEKGEAIIISHMGICEARIQPQLEEIKKALQDVNPNV